MCYNICKKGVGIKDHSLLCLWRYDVKEQVERLVNEDIKSLGVFIDDVFIEKVENKDVLNIVLDSEAVIDLNKVTEASRTIIK